LSSSNQICDDVPGRRASFRQIVDEFYNGKTSKDFPWGQFDQHVKSLSKNLTTAEDLLRQATVPQPRKGLDKNGCATNFTRYKNALNFGYGTQIGAAEVKCEKVMSALATVKELRAKKSLNTIRVQKCEVGCCQFHPKLNEPNAVNHRQL
jgi:hypothetical protein